MVGEDVEESVFEVGEPVIRQGSLRVLGTGRVLLLTSEPERNLQRKESDLRVFCVKNDKKKRQHAIESRVSG